MTEKKYRLDEMTYVEVREAIDRGIDTVVCPVGATEQHGLHGVLGIDSFCALKVGEKVAQKAKALLAPLMPYGMSSSHMSYPGTISLSNETLVHVMRDIYRSLTTDGFKKIIVVNGNEPNYYSMVPVAREIREDTGVLIAISNWYAALMEIWKELPGIKGTEREQWRWPNFMAHGGLLETAAAMTYKADIFRMDQAVTYPPDRREAISNPVLTAPVKMEEVCKFGSYGDPRAASKELGEKWVEMAATRIVERFDLLVKTLAEKV
ncbi:MAG: hypothetical protein CMO12_04015 [Thaumarchaeota archaeon]|nr:hypothetical protein [Nitrososphaerota archaeon]